MKWWVLVAVLAALALPWAAAQPASNPGFHVSTHRIDLGQSTAGIEAKETLCLSVLNATRTAGRLVIEVPRASVFVQGAVLAGAAAYPVNGSAVSREDPSNPALAGRMVVNVTQAGGPLVDGQALCVEIEYVVGSATTWTKSLLDPCDEFTLFVTPGEGQAVLPVGSMGPLVAIGDGRVHVAVPQAPAGFQPGIGFVVTPQPVEASDLTPYVWGAVGVVVGLFLMYVLVNQGWIRIHRAKKFQKGGAMESKDLLEARRRSLMAALKDLEQAHDAKLVPDAAYAPLKEEYMAQAVRVSAALKEKQE